MSDVGQQSTPIALQTCPLAGVNKIGRSKHQAGSQEEVYKIEIEFEFEFYS